MCEPVTASIMAMKASTAASAAIGGLTAATSFAGQKAAADAQEKAQAEASAAEQIRAGKANTAARLRQAQENIARAQRKEAAQIKGMDANAKARLVALTESGVGGQSLIATLGAMKAKQARYSFSETQQERMQEQQRDIMLEEESMRTRMNQLRINQPIKQASLLQAGLQGVKSGLSTAQTLQSLED